MCCMGGSLVADLLSPLHVVTSTSSVGVSATLDSPGFVATVCTGLPCSIRSLDSLCPNRLVSCLTSRIDAEGHMATGCFTLSNRGLDRNLTTLDWIKVRSFFFSCRHADSYAYYFRSITERTGVLS